MQNDNARNTIIFVVCAVAILVLYQFLVLEPAAQRQRASRAAQAEQTQTVSPMTPATPGQPITTDVGFVDRAQALQRSARVAVRSERLTGSIALRGARLDDLYLNSYRATTAPDSPPVELFRPQGAEYAYFSVFGWDGQNITGVGADTVWTPVSGEVLAPGRPVVLAFETVEGLRYERTFSVDERYMFTVTDRVINGSARPIQLRPYGSVQRRGVPGDLGRNMILHEGAVGVFGDQGLREIKYDRWRKDERDYGRSGTGGWLGITDKYWLAALIPAQNEAISGAFRVRTVDGVEVHEAVFTGQTRTVAPGATVTVTNRLFAGAKTEAILRDYQETLGVRDLDKAIDWGRFWFLTRPMFLVLDFFYRLVGNFGVAILLLTVAVKLVLFPLANKAYESMSKMKNLQPKVEDLKKRFADDPQKQQQEMLALYQREKINPLAGCLPILVQLPVFFALYKVLFVTIDMRHAPFFGWIRDLSDRDPTTLWNLFGLLPYDPGALPLVGSLLVNGFLHIGVWPIIMGFTMWLQQAMNPPPPDPIQRKIFAFFPFLFTFMLAPFAAGLVIYWTWNNLLSILQQYVIMRRFGAENPIDSLIAKLRKPKAA